jgi:hypothetical protein
LSSNNEFDQAGPRPALVVRPRRRRQVAAEDGRAAGGVGDHEPVAEQLGEQPALRTPRAVIHTDYQDPVQVRRAFKFLLRPTAHQTVALTACVEDHRQLYNAALQERRDAYRMIAMTSDSA